MIGSAKKAAISRKEEPRMTNRGVAVSMLYPIMKSIARRGSDTDRFCEYASIDPAMLQDAEARIAGEELERIVRAAAEYTRDEFFGLRQGQMMEFADMGILGYVMMHSRTVADALAAYRRYNDILCSGFNLICETRGEDAYIRPVLQYPGTFSRHCVEDMASSVYQLIGKLSNVNVPLLEVRFAHEAPADIGPYREAFGIDPVFAAEDDVLRLKKELLNVPVLYSDSRLLSIFESLAQETSGDLARMSRFSEQVARRIKKSLPFSLPTLQDTAEFFGTSARTLQNRLKEENTTFQELSVRVRKELAEGYLRQGGLSVGDIAYALHFSEPSAFQNAFKKWTGLTPGQYRANVRKSGGNPEKPVYHGLPRQVVR